VTTVSEAPDTVRGMGSKEDTQMERRWAQVLTLGEARFGILVGGPFDGRCYPLTDGTPSTLEVPGPREGESCLPLRYELRDGLYRYMGVITAERSAA
jgi:hypothetical protein